MKWAKSKWLSRISAFVTFVVFVADAVLLMFDISFIMYYKTGILPPTIDHLSTLISRGDHIQILLHCNTFVVIVNMMILIKTRH